MSVSSVTSVLDREASSQSIFEGMILHVPLLLDVLQSPLHLHQVLLIRITPMMILHLPLLDNLMMMMIEMMNMIQKNSFKMFLQDGLHLIETQDLQIIETLKVHKS